MAKSNRKVLLTSIAGTIADYRKGEISTPDADHVVSVITVGDANEAVSERDR